MAKRAAAGTLALAVCLTGGLVSATAANAAIAAGSATLSITTPNALVANGSAQALGNVVVTLPAAATFANNDSFVITAPSGVTFSGTPAVTAAYVGTQTATAAVVIGGAGSTLTVTLSGSSDTTQAETFTIADLSVTAPSAIAGTQLAATVTGLPGVSTVNLARISGAITVSPLPIITAGTTSAASGLTFKAPAAAWNAGDTIRITAPNNFSFSKAPTLAVTAGTTGANVTTQLKAVNGPTVNGVTPVIGYDVIFVDAIGTGSGTPPVTTSDVTVSLSDVSLVAPSTATGAVTLTLDTGVTTGAGYNTTTATNAAFFPNLAATVDVATVSAVVITGPTTQTLVQGAGAQLVGAIRVAEVATSNTGLGNGNYTLTFSGATVSDPSTTGYKAVVTGPARLGTPTITAAGANAVTVNVTGSSTLANDYFDVSGLYLSPTGGNVVVTVSTGGATLGTVTIPVSATATRIGGLDRYATAAQVATALQGSDLNTTAGLQPTRIDNVILAAGGVQSADGQAPDALTANYLAGRLTVAGTGDFDAAVTAGDPLLVEASISKVAPVLLTDSKTLPSATLQALTSSFAVSSTAANAYNTKTVTVVGGPNAVSADVVSSIREALPGIKVVRIEGTDRYETAAAIVLGQSTAPVRYSPTFNTAQVPTAVIASGANSADALSAGAITAEVNLPLLLTRPDALPKATTDALSAKGIGRVILLGGTNAVSANVETQLKALGIEVERFGGETRYETSANLLSWAKKPAATAATPTGGGLGLTAFDSDTVYVANGQTFADALVVGPLSAATNRSVVLTLATSLPAASTSFIKASSASSVIGIGLETSVPNTVLNAAKAAANGTDK